MSLTPDQESECLALESIYGPDYEASGDGVLISIRPHMLNDEPNYVSVKLEVVFGPSYPDTCPELLLVIPDKGLKPEKVSELNVLAQRIADENAGGMCIYEIVEQVKSALVDCNVKEVVSLRDHIQSQIEREDAIRREEEEAEAARRAEEENDKEDSDEENWDDPTNVSTIVIPPNTYVTEESFRAWNEAFLKEQEERAAMLAAKAELDDKHGRITGKQWFLENWNIADEEGGDDVEFEFPDKSQMSACVVTEETAAAVPASEMVIDESLFDDDSDEEEDYDMQPEPVVAVEDKIVEKTPVDKKEKKEKKDKDDKKDKKDKDDKKDKKDKDDKKDKGKKVMSFKDYNADAGFDGFGGGGFGSLSDFLGDVEITSGKKEKKDKK